MIEDEHRLRHFVSTLNEEKVTYANKLFKFLLYSFAFGHVNFLDDLENIKRDLHTFYGIHVAEAGKKINETMVRNGNLKP